MKKVKKLGIDSLIKEFKLLDEQQNAGTLGGSYYYDKYNGTFLGNVGSDSTVRFVTQQEWEIAQCYYVNGQGVPFSDTYVSPYAKAALLRSLLPASAQYVYIGSGGQNILEGSIAAFVPYTKSTTFAYDALNPLWNDYNNLRSIMYHESYHWNNGHVPGSPNYAVYIVADEVATIMAQINNSSYQNTTNDFKIRTADYLYQEWDSMRDTPWHTRNDAYRLAGVEGY